MAIDTAAKRLSMLDWSLGDLPQADGNINNQSDRLHLLSLYSGLAMPTGQATPSANPDPGLIYWGRR